MIIDKGFYTSHIKDQKSIMEMNRLLDKAEILLNSHTIQYTDFLDPYHIYLAKSILNGLEDISYVEFGGFEESEMKTLAIYPSYLDEGSIDSNISAIRVTGDFEKLSHKDFLGSLMGQGINRNKLGDILVHENEAFIILKDEIKNFIIFNLEKIGSINVEINEIPLHKLIIPDRNYKEIQCFISSPRLDVFISGAYNLSRQESNNIIKSGRVKVNWKPIDKIGEELKVGDMVSIKGYGRSILYSIQGKSKKGRLRSTIRILI